MAIAPMTLEAGTAGPASSFTMSLTQGWDEIPPEDGGRSLCAGDVVVLAVLSPAGPVTGPPDWVACEDGRTFWKMIGPNEIGPTFHAQGPGEWAVKGWAVASTEVTPFNDSGSSAPWMPGESATS